MTDGELLRAYCRQRSDDAFAQIVERHGAVLHAFCQRQLKDAQLAEDTVQAVFVILARKAAELPRDVVLIAWLFNTARFAVANARKVQGRQRRLKNRMEAMVNATPTASSVTADRAAQLLDQALARLSEAERSAVLLKFFEQRTTAEIGAALGISHDAAEKRIERALAKLHGYLCQEGMVLGVAVLPAALLQLKGEGLSALLTAALNQSGTPSGQAALSARVDQIVKGTLKMMTWMKWRATTLSITAGFAMLAVLAAGLQGADDGKTAKAPPANVVADKTPPKPAADAPAAGTMKGELVALLARLGGNDFDQRQAAQRELTEFVRKKGQPALDILALELIPVLRKEDQSEALARATRVVDELTVPQLLWESVVGMSAVGPEAPVLAGDVLVQSRGGLFVIDRATGSRLWSNPEFNTHTVGIAVDGDVLYTNTPWRFLTKPRADNPKYHETTGVSARGVTAWNLRTGEKLWSHELNDLYNLPTTAFANPLYFDPVSKLIIFTAGAHKNVCVALRPTGERAWTAPGFNVRLVMPSQKCVLATHTDRPDELTALSIADGSVLSQTVIAGGMRIGDLAVSDSRIAVMLVAPNPDEESAQLALLNAQTRQVLWVVDPIRDLPAVPRLPVREITLNGVSGSESVTIFNKASLHFWLTGIQVSSDAKYIASQNRHFTFCLNAADGKMLWHRPCPRFGGGLKIKDETIISGDDDGHLFAANCRDGALVWKFDLDDLAQLTTRAEVKENGKVEMSVSTISTPVVVDDTAYVTTLSGITCAFRLPILRKPNGYGARK